MRYAKEPKPSLMNYPVQSNWKSTGVSCNKLWGEGLQLKWSIGQLVVSLQYLSRRVRFKAVYCTAFTVGA